MEQRWKSGKLCFEKGGSFFVISCYAKSVLTKKKLVKQAQIIPFCVQKMTETEGLKCKIIWSRIPMSFCIIFFSQNMAFTHPFIIKMDTLSYPWWNGRTLKEKPGENEPKTVQDIQTVIWRFEAGSWSLRLGQAVHMERVWRRFLLPSSFVRRESADEVNKERRHDVGNQDWNPHLGGKRLQEIQDGQACFLQNSNIVFLRFKPIYNQVNFQRIKNYKPWRQWSIPTTQKQARSRRLCCVRWSQPGLPKPCLLPKERDWWVFCVYSNSKTWQNPNWKTNLVLVRGNIYPVHKLANQACPVASLWMPATVFATYSKLVVQVQVLGKPVHQVF